MSAAPDAPRQFASDNRAGAHPEVLDAIAAANDGHAVAYGEDPWTRRLEDRIREHFGEAARAYPVFNGTGANVLCLELLGRPHQAVVCSAGAHINADECGAPERIAGMKLLPVPTEDGKLAAGEVGRWDGWRGAEHHSQPAIVSITQASELGTVYSVAETRAIAAAAHERGMLLHVDGARLANAAAALGASLEELTTGAGADAVSFGGTKNGLLFGEIVVLNGDAWEERARFARKQLMQLGSKLRFVSAQFEALLADELWLRSARHANEMATLLAQRLEAIEAVEIVHPVDSNGVFARLPRAAIGSLLQSLPGEEPFYVWDEAEGVVRLMCSWDTTAEDVEELAAAVATATA